MQHIHDLFEANRVYSPESIPIVVFYNFEDAGTLALPWFGGWVFPAELRYAEGIAHLGLYGIRKTEEILLRRSDPVEGFLTDHRCPSHSTISQFWDIQSRATSQILHL